MRSSSRWAGGIHDHEAPAGRPLQRELRLASGEASKPLTHRLTRRRGDPAAPNLASRQLDRLESDLPAVHIQSAYDLHRDLLELHGLERPACLPRLSRGGPTTCHLYGAFRSEMPSANERLSPRSASSHCNRCVAGSLRGRIWTTSGL